MQETKLRLLIKVTTFLANCYNLTIYKVLLDFKLGCFNLKKSLNIVLKKAANNILCKDEIYTFLAIFIDLRIFIKYF
jgi:hypothetical protein